MLNSKNKGKRFELTVAHLFNDAGYKEAHRTAQYKGNTGDAGDVEGVPLLHIECKAQERMQLYDWIEQAVRDAKGNGKIPTVIHKKNNCDVLVTMRFNDWIEMYRYYEALKGEELKHDKDSKSIRAFAEQ